MSLRHLIVNNPLISSHLVCQQVITVGNLVDDLHIVRQHGMELLESSKGILWCVNVCGKF